MSTVKERACERRYSQMTNDSFQGREKTVR